MLRIRAAVENDIPQVRTIYDHHARTGFGTFDVEAPPLEAMQARFREITAAGLPYLVADDEKGVAGFAYATQLRPRPAYRFSLEDSVYIRPGSEGQGIGLLLVTDIIEKAQTWGARQMIAAIGSSENRASISLHEKCGFARTGIYASAGWKFGRWHDVVLMQRAIGPGDRTKPSEGNPT
jgi:L-amino acid N-acyltransferase YncA